MNGGKGIYVGGTLISILISLALYFSGKRETAIFVGLWAPTILNSFNPSWMKKMLTRGPQRR